MKNEFLHALLSHGGFTLTDRRPERDPGFDSPYHSRLREPEYESFDLRRPDHDFELFDECELHGVRFLVSAWRKNHKGYDWMRSRPIFEWVYTIRPLPIVHA